MHDKIYTLALRFRQAIEKARDKGELESDPTLKYFPRACCGSASSLLAKFLFENDIRTYEVCATYYGATSWDNQSHTWLMDDDGIIIDITGDQFYDKGEFLNYSKSVYVGAMDDFHSLFEFDNRDIYEFYDCTELNTRVGHHNYQMYQSILSNIEE